MLLAFAPPVVAHAAGYTVTVTVDQAAYQAREIAFRFDRLKSQINAVLRGNGRSINVISDDSEASAYVADLASNSSFIDDVRRRFASDPQYNFTYKPTETFQITYTSEARKKFEPPSGEPATLTELRLFATSLPRDLSALQTSVRFLRDPLPGIQVES